MVYQVATLDVAGDPEAIVENFETMIWTERFQELGDFQLDFPYSRSLRGIFTPGTRLTMNRSLCYMEVENTVVKDDEEGRTMLTVTGRSIDKVLTERPNRVVFGASTPPVAKWELSGLPQDVIGTIYNNIVGFGNTTRVEDRLNDFTLQPILVGESNLIPYPVETIAASLQFDSLYNSMMDIAKSAGLGFSPEGYTIAGGPDKIWRIKLTPGYDRTTDQTAVPPVIFSPTLETLSAWSELRSSENYRNVAYVFGKNGTRVVYANDAAETATGVQRRVMYVNASDIETAAGATLQNQLLLRGRAELQKHQPIVSLDGEVPNNAATFTMDYSPGDVVNMRTYEGLTSKMRVLEKIYTSDKVGERVFPTLSEDTFITPGSWASWPTHRVWEDEDIEWEDASPDF